MARRLTITDTAQQQKTINPYSQPCFTAYAMNHSHGGGYYQYDHNFNIIATTHGNGSDRYGSFRTYSTGATEFFESTSSYQSVQTNNTPSSNGGYYVSFTTAVGYLGHMSHSSPGGQSGNDGGWNMSGRDNGSSYRAYGFRDVCPIVNESHQDYAIFVPNGGNQTKQELVLGARSATQYNLLRHNSTYTGRTYIPNSWTDRSGNSKDFYTTHGGCCYNKKTNQLLVMYSTSDGRWKPVVYNNCPDLRTFAHDASKQYTAAMGGENQDTNDNSLYEYFHNTANATEYQELNTYTGYNNLSGANEARYRPQPVLCDNGDILCFSMIPGWGFTIWKWDGTTKEQDRSQPSSGLSPNGEYWHGQSWTTSYGYEQGRQYGARWQASSDGKYFWAWCPSYYYGAGIYWMAVRVSDGKILWYYTNDSTYGFQPFPIGVSSMGFNGSINTDGGAGMYIASVDIAYEMERRNYGEQLNLQNWLTQNFEGGCDTTAYGAIIPAKYDTSLFCSEPNMPNIAGL